MMNGQVQDTHLLLDTSDYVCYLAKRVGVQNQHVLQSVPSEKTFPNTSYSSGSVQIDDNLTVIMADVLGALMADDSEMVKAIIASYETDTLALNIY